MIVITAVHVIFHRIKLTTTNNKLKKKVALRLIHCIMLFVYSAKMLHTP